MERDSTILLFLGPLDSQLLCVYFYEHGSKMWTNFLIMDIECTLYACNQHYDATCWLRTPQQSGHWMGNSGQGGTTICRGWGRLDQINQDIVILIIYSIRNHVENILFLARMHSPVLILYVCSFLLTCTNYLHIGCLSLILFLGCLPLYFFLNGR